MKRIAIILITLLILFGAMILVDSNEVYGLTRELKATLVRPYSDDDGNSSIDDYYEIQRAAMQKIYKIYQEYGTAETATYPDAIYCLRAGIGFGDSGYNPVSNSVTYTEKGDMRTNGVAIRSDYNVMTGANIGNSQYNAILWIIDQLYLPRHKAYTAGMVDNSKSIAERTELKTRLLANIGRTPTTTSLTDDDIEVIQQMAIWYFSNFDQNGGANSLSLRLTTDSPAGPSLSSLVYINGGNGNTVGLTGTRMAEIQALFMYLVEEAKINAGTVEIAPNLSFLNTTPKIREKTIPPGIQTYIVGPFSLTSTGGNDYELNMQMKYETLSGIPQPVAINNVTGTVYITNADGTDQSRNKQLTDMVNSGPFYIALSKAGYNNLQKLTIEADYSYWETTKAEYMSAGVGDQPLVLVEKDKVEGSMSKLGDLVTGGFSLEIEKRASTVTGSLIPAAATFSVNRTAPTTGTKTYTTVAGKVSLDSETITTDGQVFRYQITETVAPAEYAGHTGIIYVVVETEEVGGSYVVKDAYLASTTWGKIANTTTLAVNRVGNAITITVANTSITGGFSLEIEKRASTVTGSLIPAAATFSVNKIAPTTGTKTYTTAAGRVSLDAETITATGQTFRYQITETIVPAEYVGHTGIIYVVVETEVSGSSYVVKDAYLASTTWGKIANTTTLAVNRVGNAITITVANTPITGGFSLEIEKRASTVTGSLIPAAATFSVSKTAPTTGTKTYTTTAGKVSLDSETITATGQTFRYQITETIAPTEYLGHTGIIYVVVETEVSGSSYVVKDAYLASTTWGKIANTTTLAVNRVGNAITITVANTPITGGFSLEIEKRDSTVTGSLIPAAATFSVNKTAPTTGTKTYATAAGKVSLDAETIAATGQTFRYQITETIAPAEYVGHSGIIYVVVETEVSGSSYVVKDAYLASTTWGKIANTTTLAVNRVENAITITVANTPITGGFSLEIEKRASTVTGSLIPATATFSVNKTAPTTGTKTYTTAAGKVSLDAETITATGQTFRYQITETNPPAEYVGHSGIIYVVVETEVSGSSYVVKDVYLASTTWGKIANTTTLAVNRVGNAITIVVANTEIEGGFSLEIEKRASTVTGSLIPAAATFAVTKIAPTTGVKSYTTTAGKASLDSETITATGQIFRYQITETNPPAEYVGHTGIIYVVVETEASGSSYAVKEAYLADSGWGRISNTTGLAVNRTGNAITITVANTRIAGSFSLEIEKRDSTVTGSLIPAAAIFSVNRTEPTTVTKTYTTVAGKVSLDSEMITATGQTFKYQITETSAPAEYVGYSGIIYVVVETSVSGSSYVVTDVYLTNDIGTRLSNTGTLAVNRAGNAITIVVANEKMIGSFDVEIRKVDGNGELIKDKPADFTLRVLEGGTLIPFSTNEGIAKTSEIEITESDQIFRFEIIETNAPTGYIGMQGRGVVKVTTEKQGTEYGIADIELESGTGLNIKDIELSIEGTTVVITVTNEEIEGGFNLQIIKVDEDGNIIKNNPARFTLQELPAGNKNEYVTEANGAVPTEIQAITEMDQIFRYEIVEIEAPDGYIGMSGAVIIKIITEEDMGIYKVADVEIESGTGVQVSRIGNTIVVVVTNEKVAGSFDLEIRKVDGNGELIKDKPADFTLRILEGGALIPFSTNEGIAKTSEIEITESDQIFRFEIIETLAPVGYIGMQGRGVVKVTTEKQGTEYGIADIELESGTGLNIKDIELSIEGTTVVITVINEEIDGGFNLQIRKVDKNGNAIERNSAIFTLRELPAGAADEYVTGTNGTIATGFVPITESDQTFRYEIVETKAPDGYIGMTGAGIIKVITEEDVGTYKVAGVELESGEAIEVELVGNTVIITVANEKITGEFNLEIRKTDEDGVLIKRNPTTFSLRLLESGNPKTYETSEDGTIITEDIEITEEGQIFRFELIETVAPSGYTGMQGKGIIKVTTKLQGTKYVIGAIEVETGTGLNTKDIEATISRDTAVITVKNEKIVDASGEFILQVRKTDTQNKLIERNSMMFTLRSLESNTAITFETTDDGTVIVGDVVITEEGQIFRYELIEIAAPDGYEIMKGRAIIKVTTAIRNGAHTVVNVEIEEGNELNTEDVTVRIVDNMIEITVKDEETKIFDLALRKFITKVDDKVITSRIPEVQTDKNGQLKYVHTKEPVEVANSNIVTYTIRVYNEGTKEGYAQEVQDDIPEGLQYLPEHATNKKYEWKMYYVEGGTLVETNDVTKATEIRTGYLSLEKESASRANKLKAFNPDSPISKTTPLNPDYKDIEVAFAVIEPNTSSRIIINTAQISADSDDDIDSIPDNNKNGEDDIDKEYIYVKYFDLSLIKWTSHTIVTVDGKTTTTSYEMPVDDPGSEYLVKVDLDKKNLDKATVKFVYTIMIINEGEIAGYAKEITDDIPEGLLFVEADNPLWTKGQGNKVTTKALENMLLQPGENAKVDIILTWKNDGANVGLKKNTAEISKDYNEYGAKDKDSEPNNWDEKEDDQDFALVILTIRTGESLVQVSVIGMSLTILLGGVALIKKYVLSI